MRVPEALAEYRIHEGSASFRVMPVPRAEEIVRVVEQHWSQRGERDKARKALARAQALAAKNHAQSGRLGAALLCFGRALRLRPALTLEVAIWRQLFVGLLRRAFYKVRSAQA